MVDLSSKLYQEQHHPMSLHAFRLSEDSWLPWLPPSDHKLHAAFHGAAIRASGSDYAEQKELLDKIHEEERVDEFVASFSGIQRDNVLTSYCVWSEDVVALLPKTDCVMFCRGDGDDGFLGRADWNRVMDVVGELMEEVEDLYPARYRVREFPTAAQLQQLHLQ
jgi:hypothetical protein